MPDCLSRGKVTDLENKRVFFFRTLREIVDKSFNEDWPANIRQEKVAEEVFGINVWNPDILNPIQVKRLGLPPNPRLSRQIDNRIAYLRRVKNLQETKKIQDQIEPQVRKLKD